MTPSYYDTLGVAPDASPDEIKAAKRRKSSELHPDRGGSDEAMALVNRAYDVLSDPERRARYDAGEDEQASPEEAMAAVAHQLLVDLVRQAADAPGNMVANLRSTLQRTADEMQRRAGNDRQKAERLKKRATKIRTKQPGAQNLLREVIEAQAAGLERDADNNERNARTAEMALALLDVHEDEEPQESQNLFRSLTRDALFSGMEKAMRDGTWGHR